MTDDSGVDPVVSARMRSQPSSSTGPEVAVRRALHAAGVRFRLHKRVVPGAPRRTVDIVLGPARIAVDVRGCFWHGCPEHCRVPVTRSEWWAEKIESNLARDADTVARLTAAGWAVVVVWEHDDPVSAAAMIAALRHNRLYH